MAQYIDRKTVNDSYRPRAGTMSPGLKRAREPYRIRNALTGVALCAFAVGVYAYSISAVKQDIFDDVDEEARAMVQTGAINERLKVEGKPLEPSTLNATVAPSSSIPRQLPPPTPSQGLLRHLDGRFPWLLDPQRKTLVWGAPPVNDVGQIEKS